MQYFSMLLCSFASGRLKGALHNYSIWLYFFVFARLKLEKLYRFRRKDLENYIRLQLRNDPQHTASTACSATVHKLLSNLFFTYSATIKCIEDEIPLKCRKCGNEHEFKILPVKDGGRMAIT